MILCAGNQSSIEVLRPPSGNLSTLMKNPSLVIKSKLKEI